jgi:hypothetical protein
MCVCEEACVLNMRIMKKNKQSEGGCGAATRVGAALWWTEEGYRGL